MRAQEWAEIGIYRKTKNDQKTVFGNDIEKTGKKAAFENKFYYEAWIKVPAYENETNSRVSDWYKNHKILLSRSRGVRNLKNQAKLKVSRRLRHHRHKFIICPEVSFQFW